MVLFDSGPSPFKDQKLSDAKKSLKRSELWTDSVFPPERSSLFLSSFESDSGIEWKRPGDIIPDPKFVVDGYDASDINQGRLGNCWFIAACSALTHRPSLLKRVIPDGQSFDKGSYNGIFRFHFWRFGDWVEVLVDDWLPTSGGKLLYASSKTPNEFWSPLLEKAFAKLVGSYEALTSGGLGEALTDLSGGVPETLRLLPSYANLEQQSMALFKRLKEAHKSEALMAASIECGSRAEREMSLACGLVKGHAYAVTAVKKIMATKEDEEPGWLERIFGKGSEKVFMIRLQNPWGAKEWNGPWSDDSLEWNRLTDRQKDKLGLTFDEDGEFWMPWSEFCRYMSQVCIVHQVNTALISFSPRFTETAFKGAWKADLSQKHLSHRAGGCPNYRDTFLWNPQYALDIPGDFGPEEYVLICLTQENVRERRREGAMLQTMGMQLMKIENNRVHRCNVLLERSHSSDYINARSVFLRLQVIPAGRYVLIPTTYEPGRETAYLLRVFMPRRCSAPFELTQDLCGWKLRPKGFAGKWPELCPCVPHSFPSPFIYSLRVIQGHDIASNEGTYVSVDCDGVTYYSPVAPMAAEPFYNYGLLLLRQEPKGKMMIKVWESVKLKDKEVGWFELDVEVEDRLQGYKVTLMEPGVKKNSSMALSIALAHYKDPINF